MEMNWYESRKDKEYEEFVKNQTEMFSKIIEIKTRKFGSRAIPGLKTSIKRLTDTINELQKHG